MKNRVHITFETPEDALALVDLLNDKQYLSRILDKTVDSIEIRTPESVEGFHEVHPLTSIKIKTKN